MSRHCCPTCFSDEHLTASWCPDVWIDEVTGIRVISFPDFKGGLVDTGEAYDRSQTNDDLRDGDLFRCQHDGREVWAVLVEAWPVAFDGLDEEGRAGQLHTLEPGASLSELDGGKYASTVDIAWRWFEAQSRKTT